MSLLNIEPIKISEYVTTYDSTTGLYSKTLVNVKYTTASIQPLDYLAMGGITSLLEKYADRTVQAVKVYLKYMPANKAVITRLNSGREYELWKEYNYNEFGLSCDHYKLVMYYIED